MSIQIYNTLSRRKEPFVPREPGNVAIYVCGITPYDESHLGHAVPSIIWDAIRRFLEYEGYTVRLVQNFTDIDDKVIQRALETGEDALAVSNRYVQAYLEEMDALGVKRATVYPRVSQEIPAIVGLVQSLIAKGHAYVADGDVFFDVSSFPQYGQLSGQVLDELAAGTRFAVDARKRNAMDFALWKSAKPGEPAWDSPWGEGRPGWHIECSAMALKYLGNHLDLHGGGADLIFPHHENEIAQSDAHTGEPPFVNYWMHNGLLQIEDEKMSKSLGNYMPLSKLLARHPAPAIRFYLLSSHYRSPLQYSEEKLAEAQRGWERLRTAVAALISTIAALEETGTAARSGVMGGDGAGGAESRQTADAVEVPLAVETLASAVGGTRERFVQAMRDDFNTAAAIGTLFELVREVQSCMAGLASVEAEERLCSLPVLYEALRVFTELGGDILGIVVVDEVTADGEDLVKDLVQLLISVRRRAREAKDWATADFIRDELSHLGIKLEDSPLGTRWRT